MRSSKLFLAGLVLVAACGHDHDHETDQFTCDGDEDSLAAGTAKSGDNGLTLTIVEAIPPQHYVQNNELVLAVSDDSGPQGDVDFTKIETFTAKHNHGSPVPVQWEATANAGEYRVFDLNYVHQGPWHVNFELTAGSVSDFVQFTFCIHEPPGTPDAGQ